jgi:chromosome segregation ATPase
MRVLRSHIEKTERTISDRDRDIADRDAALGDFRARVVEAERAAVELTSMRDALHERTALAERRTAELEALLRVAERTADESRARADHLHTLLRQPRHRFAENGNNALKRWTPWIHRLVRPLFASAARNPNPWP